MSQKSFIQCSDHQAAKSINKEEKNSHIFSLINRVCHLGPNNITLQKIGKVLFSDTTASFSLLFCPNLVQTVPF